MKLDTTHLRYLSDNDFRVLTAVYTDNNEADIGRNGKQKPFGCPYAINQSNRQTSVRECIKIYQ
jgi:hypothetical protein